MKEYRLVNRKFMAVQLAKENIKETYDWLSEFIKVDVTLGTNYTMTIHTKPFHTKVSLGQFVARDEQGEIIVRDADEFMRYFKLL